MTEPMRVLESIAEFERCPELIWNGGYRIVFSERPISGSDRIRATFWMTKECAAELVGKLSEVRLKEEG